MHGVGGSAELHRARHAREPRRASLRPGRGHGAPGRRRDAAPARRRRPARAGAAARAEGLQRAGRGLPGAARRRRGGGVVSHLALVVAVVLWATAACAQVAFDRALDRVHRALGVASADGRFRADLSGLLDVEGYYIDQRPPGLVFGGGSGLVNPRLTLFLDAHAGPRLYGFVRARFDRGFDPRERPAGSARLDEYLGRWTPLADPRLNLQFGKFATVFGNWAARDDSWTNPFINAPLPYENVTIVGDAKAPASLDEFLARRNVPDKKNDWVPMVWGPSYTSGGAVFGRLGAFDYAAEAKNAPLSTRPHYWDPSMRASERPSAAARLGWRPGAAVAVGASFASA